MVETVEEKCLQYGEKVIKMSIPFDLNILSDLYLKYFSKSSLKGTLILQVNIISTHPLTPFYLPPLLHTPPHSQSGLLTS